MRKCAIFTRNLQQGGDRYSKNTVLTITWKNQSLAVSDGAAVQVVMEHVLYGQVLVVAHAWVVKTGQLRLGIIHTVIKHWRITVE